MTAIERLKLLKIDLNRLILVNNLGDPNCKKCNGHGCLDFGDDYSAIMDYCPYCYTKKRKKMKTLYRIYEFLFDRWKWEIYKEEEIEHYNTHLMRRIKEEIPHKRTLTVIYKLTNKFDCSIKYKSKTIEI